MSTTPHGPDLDSMLTALGTHVQDSAPPVAVPTGAFRDRTEPAWLAIAAVVLAVLAVAVGLTVVLGDHRADRPAATPPRTFVPSSSAPRSSPPGHSGAPAGPWNATPVAGAAQHAVPEAGNRTSLYALDGSRLLRLDPATGQVLAAVTVAAEPGSFVIAGDALWFVPDPAATPTNTLTALDLSTLRPVGTVRVPGATHGIAAVAASADSSRLFAASDTGITVVDAATRTVITDYPIPSGQLAALSESPDGTRLYVSSNITDTATTQVAVLDPDTGVALRPPARIQGGTGYRGLLASAGGIWLATGSGHTATVAFHPATDLSQTILDSAVTGGGGYDPTATPTNTVVWLGGPQVLVCADPITGLARARVAVPPATDQSPTSTASCPSATTSSPRPKPRPNDRPNSSSSRHRPTAQGEHRDTGPCAAHPHLPRVVRDRADVRASRLSCDCRVR